MISIATSGILLLQNLEYLIEEKVSQLRAYLKVEAESQSEQENLPEKAESRGLHVAL